MDGIQDAGEPGIPGARVNLYDTLGNPIASVRTDANGNYSFTGLPAGSYQVEFELPVGYDGFSPRDVGIDANDSDPDPVTGIVQVSLDPGDVRTNIDAGMFITGLDPIEIGDFVWLDANDNLLPNDSEWLNGVDVVLYDALGVELARIATDKSFFTPQQAQANYLFTGVAQGDYRVAIDTSTLPAAAVQIADPDSACPNSACNQETELLDLTDAIPNDNLKADFGYAQPDFALVKTATPKTYAAIGEVINYSFVVTNNGAVRITGPITINDDQATNELCPALTTVGNNDLYLDKGESITCTASYTITASDITAGSVVNIASASGLDPNGNPVTTPTDTETVTLDAADLAIEKSVSDSSPDVGDTVTYTITLTNLGPNAATGVEVVDTLPNGLGTIDAITPSGTHDAGAGTITWSGLSVVVGTPVTLSYTAVVPEPVAGVVYENTAEVTESDQYDPEPDNNQDDASLTPLQADLQVTKVQIKGPEQGGSLASKEVVNPSTIIAGTRIYYLLTVVNNSPTAAINAVVTDTLPAGISNVQFSRNFGSSWFAWTGSFTYANFAANSTDTIVIRGTVAANQTVSLTNIASVESDTYDPVSANDDDDLVTPVTAQADLALTKEELDSPVTAGGAIDYRITVTNLGPSDATGVTITDSVHADVTNVQFSVDGGATYADWTDSYEVGPLAKGDQFVLLIKGTVVASPSVTSIPNTASVDATTEDPEPDNDSETIDTPLDESVDIGIVKTGSPASVTAGEKIVYTMTVTNLNAAGGFAAQKVHIDDTLDTTLFSDIEYSETSAAGPWLSWTGRLELGDLAAASAKTVWLRATVKSNVTATSVTNTASVATDTPDTNPANDSDSAETTVTRSADLTIEKKLLTAPENVVAGGQVEYELVYSNLGSSDATNVVVTDTVPADIENPEAAFCATTSYSAWSGSANVGTVVAGGVCRIFIRGTLKATYSGALTNTASVASDVTDPVLTNNAESEDITVLNPSIELTKVGTLNDDDGKAGVSAGDSISYTFSVTNTGNADLTAITLSDPKLPALTCAPIASLTQGETQTVICTAGASHPLIQADIDLGTFTNTATVTAKDPGGRDVTDDDDDTRTLTQTATLTIDKTADPDTYDAVGEIIGYQFLVTNTGNVTISALRVDDEKTTDESCPVSTLAPGANTTCTASYTITLADLNAGKVTNTAKATGIDPKGGTVASPTDDETITAEQRPALSLVKTATPTTFKAVGDKIDYSFRVTNTGNVSLHTIVIADDKTTDESCPKLSSVGNGDAFLDQGEVVICSASHLITDADLIAGTLTNKATASGKDPADKSVSSLEATATVTAQLATLFGHLYIDTNGNGRQDAGEPDLANVDVLITPVVGTPFKVTTGPDGDWTAEVPAGVTTADVDESDPDFPAGFAQTEGDDPTSVTAVVGTDTDAGNDGYSALWAIGNRVWLDDDGDGEQDAGEAGIPNLTIKLFAAGADPSKDLPLQTTVTDADGGYLFTVEADEYLVAVTRAAGLKPTYDEDGIADDSVDVIDDIRFGAGTEHLTADFGYNWVTPLDSTNPAQGAKGAIGDRVWNDANANGRQDPGESGIGGITVKLLTDSNGDGVYGGAGDDPAATTDTAADGSYIFKDLAHGAYVIQVDSADLVGWTQTGDPDEAGTCVTCDGRTTSPIILAPGDVYVNADFGYRLPADQVWTIGDRVYLDANADGSDGGLTGAGAEPGIPGVIVALLDKDDKVIATDVTDADGIYVFPGLPEGDYSVVVIDTANVLGEMFQTGDPDATLDRRAETSLTDANDLDQDFGFAPLFAAENTGFIGDTVFLDTGDGAGGNPDGSFQPGEGLEGVRVSLYTADGLTLLASTLTDENGHYGFAGLDLGATYVVQVDTTTLPNGGAGLTNTVDPNGGNDSRAQRDLASLGPVDLAADFGYAAAAPNTIGGTIWEDRNADGTLTNGSGGSANETANGLSGITVVLYEDLNGNGKLDNSEPIVARTVTDADGDYRFPGLPDGDYLVQVTDLADLLGGYWKSNGPNAGADNNSQIDPYAVQDLGVGQATGVTNTTADFGYYRDGAALGNRAWLDNATYNGLQDDGETGVAGVKITLTIAYPNGDSSSQVTLTAADGTYRFGNLLLDESFPASTVANPAVVGPRYRISAETAPTGYVAGGILNAGSNHKIDSDAHAGVTAAALVRGATDTAVNAADPGAETDNAAYDFAYLPTTILYRISGVIYDDTAGTGNLAQRGSMGKLAGVTVRLYTDPNGDGDPADGVQVGAAVVTDADGAYSFANLPPDDYVVVETNPVGYTSTNDVDTPNDDRIAVTLSNADVTAQDFLDTPTANSQLGSIAGQVRDDSDGDGNLGDSESGLANVVVELWLDTDGDGTPDSLYDSRTTDATGNYRFNNLPPGAYVVVETNPTGYVSTGDKTLPNDDRIPVILISREVSTGNDFLDSDQTDTLVSVSGIIVNDANGSGTQDAGDGYLGGVSLALVVDSNDNGLADPGEPVFATTTSSATDGSYSFTNLPKGKYVVVETDPAGYISTADAAGANDNQVAADASAGNVGGRNFLDAPASLTADISGQVRNDVDGDGELSETPAEAGIPGVTVTLYRDVNANGVYDSGTDTQAASTTTDSDGKYRFTNWPLGRYLVVETDPTGATSTGDKDGNSPLANGLNAIAVELLATGSTGNDFLDTASADLVVEKNGPVLVDSQGTITYTVTVSNAGPSPANDAVFKDDQPAGLTAMAWNCGNAVGGAVCPSDKGDGSINEMIALFPAGGSLTYTITGKAPDGKKPDDLPVINVGTVTPPAFFVDPDESNNSDRVETGLGETPSTADLSVLKYGPAQIETGGAMTYRILVTNAGYAAANNAVFTDTVPADVTDVSWICTAVGGAICPDGITRTGNNISETIATFPAGGSLIYTVTGTVTAGIGVIFDNTATITAPLGVTDPDPSNNSDSVKTSVVDPEDPLPSADLALVKTGPATVAGGGSVTYKLVVSNTGGDAADGAAVSDRVPSVLVDVIWTCGNTSGGALCPKLNDALDPGDLNSGKGAVNMSIPTFPAGSSLTITVTGRAPAAGAFVNSAQVMPPEGVVDPDPSNNPGGPVITQIPMVTLSGVVFNDCPRCGGSAGDGIQNGTEPGVDPVEPGSLNVVILDGEGLVLVVVPIAEDGSWQAIVPMGSGYQAFITTGTPPVGSEPDPVTASLPSGWVITGENDSLDNGILIAIDANTSVTGLNFGIEASDNAIELLKTAFWESGASCATAKSPLVYVNKTQDPVDVTWCFTVTNQGNEALANPQITDAPLGIDQDDMTLSSGSLPLLPGAKLVYTYSDAKRKTSLENSASVSMTPVGGGDPVTAEDDEAIFAYVFDPPYGVKTGRVNGLNVIRWEMVWINNSPIDLNGVVIEDPIQAGMTYRPGTLSCDARGSTTVVGTCGDANYDAVNRLIQVTANFGPDLGAFDRASADNELVITFEVTIDNPTVSQSFANQATATWDPDGPGGDDPVEGVTDDETPGGSDPTPIDFEPPVPIPTLSEWAMILLTLMLMGMVWRSRSRFGVNL